MVKYTVDQPLIPGGMIDYIERRRHIKQTIKQKQYYTAPQKISIGDGSYTTLMVLILLCLRRRALNCTRHVTTYR